jgi:hypothetical protein
MLDPALHIEGILCCPGDLGGDREGTTQPIPGTVKSSGT